MRIVHITAGAGGRLCGSCMHDNTLVRSLRQRGRDAILVPAYVPTTTDEENVAEGRIVMGGVNVWLQEYLPLFRHTPALFDRLLDARGLLAWLSRRTGSTRPADLGGLTVSSLQGELGHQRKEVEKLARWLAADIQPDIVHFSNVLLVGLARRVREATGAKIVVSLSGEDIFLEQLPEPHYSAARQLLRQRAADIDCCVALNHFFASFMADYLALPAERIAVVPHGVDTAGFAAVAPDLALRRRKRGGRLVIGSLARACPEKGLELLVRSLALLAPHYDVELRAAGAEIDAEQAYLKSCHRLAAELGVAKRFVWLGQVDRPGKIELLESIDLFAMPTVHPEAKGIPVLEACAAGVPVVAPAHGTFPEYLHSGTPQATGLTHRPGDAADLAAKIALLLDDVVLCQKLGAAAWELARSRHTLSAMAAGHEAIYARLLQA